MDNTPRQADVFQSHRSTLGCLIGFATNGVPMDMSPLLAHRAGPAPLQKLSVVVARIHNRLQFVSTNSHPAIFAMTCRAKSRLVF